jgi:hypothetical protein
METYKIKFFKMEVTNVIIVLLSYEIFFLIPFIPCSVYKSNVQGFPTTFIHMY